MGFFGSSQWKGSSQPLAKTIPQCGRCGLFKSCISPKMEVTGRGKRKILFIGEAPGEVEDQRGEQLIGPAGQCLRKMLRSIDVDLEGCWKHNALSCRPPENKTEAVHIACCQPNVTNAITKLKPNVIILLGLSAIQSLIPLEWSRDVGGMGRWAGWAIPSKRWNAWICPTYHPSFVLRCREDPALVKITTDHLKRAMALEHKTPPWVDVDALLQGAELITDIRQGRLRMKELAKKKGRLAFDYETTGLKPESKGHQIVCSSFCFEGEDKFCCNIGEDNYAALRRVVENPELKKVGSNIKFETRWSRVILGSRVRGWLWDTMLAAHVLDNRAEITSIKFQAFTRMGIGDYSASVEPYLKAVDGTANGLNRVLDAPRQELLRYCCLDSVIEDTVALQQMKEFKL